MAKTLLQSGKVVCADLTDEESQDYVTRHIDGQNHQIQLMNGYLKAKEYPAADNYVAEVEAVAAVDSRFTVPRQLKSL
jgi:hypothetical protein